MAVGNIEISAKGQWVRVPGFDLNGRTIVVRGKGLKKAVIHDEEWLETEIDDPEAYVRELLNKRTRELRADFFTFAQKPPATAPQYKYFHEWDSIAAVRTTNYQEWWESLPQETRKNVRRSQKRGVQIRAVNFDDDLIRGIVEINNESPLRQGSRSRDYGKSFDEVKRDHSSFLDRSDLFGAYFGDELIGFLKIVHRGNIVSLLQLLVKARHSDKRPSNALMAKAVEVCHAKGIQYLTYGLYNYGNKGDSPIRQFKIRNGFEEILVPRYYVPLTAWGTLCLKLKIHRGLLGILPHAVISMGINARVKWYDFRSRLAGVAQ